ncbi:MAG: hypothetical protein RMI91_01815 [Gemmatales bacterium]|nr:hypothetical protein [Gemmatales bacterium]MDW7993363.1 hypothetical protein [Gemmatales bacterium]
MIECDTRLAARNGVRLTEPETSDRSAEVEALVLVALRRGLTASEGLPLFASGRQPGLFPRHRVGKQAAEFCLQRGWLEVVGEATALAKGQERYWPSEAGVRWLVEQGCARLVLEALSRQIGECERHWQTWAEQIGQVQRQLEQLRRRVETALAVLAPEQQQPERFPIWQAEVWQHTLLRCLRHWQDTHPQEDCPLPELFRQVQARHPYLTVGAFQDGLRRGHAQGRILLHPWAGPIHEIPEPEFALLIGHALVYYASLRPW